MKAPIASIAIAMIVLAPASGLAEEATPAPAPAPAAAAAGSAEKPAEGEKPAEEPVAAYELKNKSSFNVPPGARPPYWPIGWKPDAPGQAPTLKVEINEDFFQVSSILLGNPSLAVINGRSYEEGQYIRVPKNDANLRPRLFRIGDGQVWVQIGEQMITAPLRRQSLNPNSKRPDEVLNADREMEEKGTLIKPATK